MDDNLLAISREGNIDEFYSLIRQRPHVLDDIEGKLFVENPMHEAAVMGRTHFVLEMMRLNPSYAKQLNPEGFSPFHLALQYGHRETVLRMLDVDRDLVCVQGREGVTPLHYVAGEGNLQLLDVFLSACPNSAEVVTVRNQTALHVALERQDLSSIERLLEWSKAFGYARKRKFLNWKDEDGMTALHIATTRSLPQVVKALIDHRVEINAINMVGSTPLDISEQQNTSENQEIRDMLLQAGALNASSLLRVESSEHYLSMDGRLKAAAEAGDANLLYHLIQEDPYLLERIDEVPFIHTPLHIAASQGHIQFFVQIMRWKPSFARKPNQEGLYPIHLALENGHILLVRQLLEIDGDLVRLPGRDSNTPLHHAAEHGNLHLLRLFLSVCPLSILDLTLQRETALHVAVKNFKFDALDFLLGRLLSATHKGSSTQKEQILNRKDERGNTVLHVAALINQPQVVEHLINCGAKKKAKNLEDLTAQDILKLQKQESNRERVQDMRYLAEVSITASSLPSPATPINLSYSKISLWQAFIVALIRLKKDLSTEDQNALLVVTVLFLTATYDCVLNPPKFDENYKFSASFNTTCINTTSNYIIGQVEPPTELGGAFWLFNFLTLLTSIATILFLLPGNYFGFMSYSAFPWFLVCYAYALNNSYLGAITILSTFICIFVLALSHLPSIARRWMYEGAKDDDNGDSLLLLL